MPLHFLLHACTHLHLILHAHMICTMYLLFLYLGWLGCYSPWWFSYAACTPLLYCCLHTLPACYACICHGSGQLGWLIGSVFHTYCCLPHHHTYLHTSFPLHTSLTTCTVFISPPHIRLMHTFSIPHLTLLLTTYCFPHLLLLLPSSPLAHYLSLPPHTTYDSSTVPLHRPTTTSLHTTTRPNLRHAAHAAHWV